MRTDNLLNALVAHLTTNYGDVFEACKSCGVSLMFVHQWRKDDADVDGKLREAESVGALRIESVALQRAMNGHEENVYYQGELAGSRTVHHDSLTALFLKAKRPGFEKDSSAGATFNGPTQINIMPRAENYEQWLTMKDATLSRREELPALPAPGGEVIEAEFVPVRANPFAGIEI